MDLTEIATQAPGVGAILLIVAWFLKALKARDYMLKRLGEDYEKSRDECHAVQRDAIEVMRENSRAFGQNTELLRETISLLRTLNGKRKD